MSDVEKIRSECWDKALHCLGTSYVFQQKGERFSRLIRWISILGIILPLTVGGIAITYGVTSNLLKWSIWIVAPILIAQLLMSGLSVINKWDSLLSYSQESQSENRSLSDQYQKLAKYPPVSYAELEKQFEILLAIDNERSKQDEKIFFSGKETRMGMRYGLMILRRACVNCNEVPISMESSKCTVCGNF